MVGTVNFKMGRSQSRMTGLSRDRKVEFPEGLTPYFSHFLREISGSREIAFGNADLYTTATFKNLANIGFDSNPLCFDVDIFKCL